jgi:hypothetical protein
MFEVAKLQGIRAIVQKFTLLSLVRNEICAK